MGESGIERVIDDPAGAAKATSIQAKVVKTPLNKHAVAQPATRTAAGSPALARRQAWPPASAYAHRAQQRSFSHYGRWLTGFDSTRKHNE